MTTSPYFHVQLLIYLRTLDSSVSNSIRKRIPTETRVWYTAWTYFEKGITNSHGLALMWNRFVRNAKTKISKDKILQPRIIKYSEAAISSSSMSSSSKQSNVHTVTWENGWWHHSLGFNGTADTQKQLVFFIPRTNIDKELALSFLMQSLETGIWINNVGCTI